MTKDQFIAAYRGPMLLFLTEAWAARREAPSALGLLLEEHHRRARALLGEMFDTLCPLPNPAVTKPAGNGQQVSQSKAVRT